MQQVAKTDINPSTGKAYGINPSSGQFDDNYWANQVDPVVNGAAKQKQQQDDAFNKQVASDKGDVTDFLTKYNTDTQSAIGAASTKYDLPGQLAGVNALNTRVKTLQGNTDNSGAGGYSSGQQVDAALNSRYLPQYSTALTNLIGSEGQATNEENQALAPDVAAGSALNNRIASEMTGFNQTQSNQLQTYLGQLNAGVTLTKAQLDNANALAIAQKNYQAAIDSQKIQSQNQTLPAGSTYYNPVTGTAYNPFATVLKP